MLSEDYCCVIQARNVADSAKTFVSYIDFPLGFY